MTFVAEIGACGEEDPTHLVTLSDMDISRELFTRGKSNSEIMLFRILHSERTINDLKSQQNDKYKVPNSKSYSALALDLNWGG